MAEPSTAFRLPPRDSVANTLLVAIGLSLVCSVLVASTAVMLQPRQIENAESYRQRIILGIAGLDEPGMDVAQRFAEIEPRMVELSSGDYVDWPEVSGFDAAAAAADPDLGTVIPPQHDLAGIRRRANYAPVYLVKDGSEIEQIILPVYGSGLWSTMYGYLALESDADTVRGLRFYSHAETPGLGDQIDKPEWRAKWPGKKLFGEDGRPRIEVIRGAVASDAAYAVDSLAGATDTGDTAYLYQVDGLAGATLTGRGVTNLIHYWTGEHGFGPYLQNIRQREGSER